MLTPPEDDFPRWYQEVVAKAELAENGPVRGTMVIRPYGYAIWELVQADIDRRIKELGVQNAYFPLLVPEHYLRREAEHVEGFSPELAVVTHAGGRELEEPAVIRPTSETIINASFARWIHSYRDLPLLVNQWANVVRWELRPRLFLRTTEFLWQEGHTAHASEQAARSFALEVLEQVYVSFMRELLAIPVLAGQKTAGERFAGATATWTCEAMMGDGKALQMGTSHELGQNFSRAFGITYLDQSGSERYAWQTSWGVSTRLMGALVMAHGDRSGLRLPPKVAPIQVAVVAVREAPGVAEAVDSLVRSLKGRGIRAVADLSLETSFGRRVVNWEIKGVPVRLDLGPRDIAAGQVIMVRRDTGEKMPVAITELPNRVEIALGQIGDQMRSMAAARMRDRTETTSSLDDAIEAASTGFASFEAGLLGADEAGSGTGRGEAKLNAAGVTVRLLQQPDGALPEPGDKLEDLIAIAARAY